MNTVGTTKALKNLTSLSFSEVCANVRAREELHE